VKFNNINRKEFNFWTKLKTRWIDMDSMCHINHTSYLSYIETARIDFFSSLDISDINKNLEQSVILASLEISYLNQVSHPSVLNIGHKVCRVGSKSFDLLSGVFTEDKLTLICIAIFKMVSFNYKTNKSILIPKQIIDNNKIINE